MRSLLVVQMALLIFYFLLFVRLEVLAKLRWVRKRIELQML
jgi:hypothetical protein